jgi:hypothetical protein
MSRLIFLLLLSSCARHGEKTSIIDLSSLREKVVIYKELNKTAGDKYGYVHSKCDGVGFTALCKTAGGCPNADIFASESRAQPGRWFRYPTQDCFDTKESRTDDSNDHALMRMVYLYSTGNLDALKNERAYLKTANGNLGRDDGSAEGLDANQFAYSGLLSKLIGPSFTSVDIIPSGYRGHLFLLYALLDAQASGQLDATTIFAIRGFIKDNPKNAIAHAILHKYLDGDQSDALTVLMDTSLFPHDRLPTSADHCEEYLWQRDEHTADWEPCPENKTHSGTDFLFAAWIML